MFVDESQIVAPADVDSRPQRVSLAAFEICLRRSARARERAPIAAGKKSEKSLINFNLPPAESPIRGGVYLNT